MEVMVIMATTARERLSQLPLLKLMLSQDIIIMVTLMVMAMDTATMVTMARGRPMLSPGIIIMLRTLLWWLWTPRLLWKEGGRGCPWILSSWIFSWLWWLWTPWLLWKEGG